MAARIDAVQNPGYGYATYAVINKPAYCGGVMEILIIAAILGFIPAAIASGKGHSFGLWWLFGAAAFILALPCALLLKKNTAAIERSQLEQGMKKCPFCAEMVKAEATVCRYCQNKLA